MQNALRRQLKDGKTTFGVTIGIGSPEVPYALSNLDLDWLNFDTQHSVLNESTISHMIQALGHSKIVPIVRVLSNDLGHINKALDMGAQAVIVPLVNTKAEAEKAVQSAKYKPPGSRSYTGRAALKDPDYVKTADDEIMVMPQIETALALENVEDIVTTDGIEGVFCGPYDLSMSLGIFRQFEHPTFQHAIERFVSACESHGVAPGLLAPIGPVQKNIQRGFKMISLGGDLAFLIQAISDTLKTTKQ